MSFDTSIKSLKEHFVKLRNMMRRKQKEEKMDKEEEEQEAY